jgi:hypothetical protein
MNLQSLGINPRLRSRKSLVQRTDPDSEIVWQLRVYSAVFVRIDGEQNVGVFDLLSMALSCGNECCEGGTFFCRQGYFVNRLYRTSVSGRENKEEG